MVGDARKKQYRSSWLLSKRSGRFVIGNPTLLASDPKRLPLTSACFCRQGRPLCETQGKSSHCLALVATVGIGAVAAVLGGSHVGCRSLTTTAESARALRHLSVGCHGRGAVGRRRLREVGGRSRSCHTNVSNAFNLWNGSTRTNLEGTWGLALRTEGSRNPEGWEGSRLREQLQESSLAQIGQ